MKDWLIKKLGGFTLEELQSSTSRAQQASAKQAYQRGFDNGIKHKDPKPKNKSSYDIKKSYSWLKSEIHRKLDIIFPGKEYERSKYKWLRRHTKQSSHISAMGYEELSSMNNLLGEI